MASYLNCRTYIQAELERRQKANPRYSLRAFAKALSLDAGYLSNVLVGKRLLSIGAVQKIASAMDLSKSETNLLLESATAEINKRALQRHKLHSDIESTQTKRIENDSYDTISDMLHYFILESTYLDDSKKDAKWIARSLGRTVVEVEDAVARLIRLGMLTSTNESLTKTDSHFVTKDVTRTSAALKASQRQILKSALKALDTDPIEKRSSTGMTMCIDPDKLPIAKKMIAEFTDKLCLLLESDARKEVYQLSIGLFPLAGNLVEKDC